jgi:hypothetical protein
MSKPTDINIVELLRPFRDQGWHWDAESGKLTTAFPTSMSEDIPWITQNLDFDCFLWNRMFHHGVAKQQMVHTHCQTCFKVVVMPRNFLELIELERWQAACGLRCKCGIEVRDYVSRLYGGYFYSWEPGELMDKSVETPDRQYPVTCRVVNDMAAQRKGRDKYKLITFGMKQVLMNYLANWPDAPKLTKPMPLILKRGCTEFEAHCGPTDQPRYRNITDEQLMLEAKLEESVDFDGKNFVTSQAENIKDAIRMKWAEFAHFVGDMTYQQWLGRAISTPPVTYHEE